MTPTSIEVNTANVLWAVGAMATIIATTAAVVWTIRNDRLQQLRHENEVLKDAKTWKLPDTLISLNQISEKLSLQLGEKDNLDSLRVENESLRSSNSELQAEVSKLKESILKLETALNNSILDSQDIEVNRGESADLIRNAVAVAVENVYDTAVGVIINNDRHHMNVGNVIEIPYANKICVLRLKTIKRDTTLGKAVFSFGLRDSQPQSGRA